MVRAKLSQAADPKGVIGRLNHFTEVDVIRVEFGDRNGICNLRVFTVAVREPEGTQRRVVLKCGLVGWLVVPVVVDRQENWVEHCGDGNCRCSGCRSMSPRCHQRREWGCSSDWMGLQLVEVRLHGLWIGGVVSRNVGRG